ncbi:MAG TPA: glycosyltransferase family 4 protein [Micromonosporaceae bacterium]|nr:glycosyltransferase family 4 protein [Micromonosporaceae bacterium]
MDGRDAAQKHVLFLNWRDTSNPEGGGSEVFVEKIAAELIARGHRATIFCAAHSGAPRNETSPDGIHFLRRGGRHTVYVRAALTYLAGALGIGRLSARGLGRPHVLVDVCNGIPFLAPAWSRRPVLALVHHVHRKQWNVVFGRGAARIGWWIESRLAIRVYRRCRYVTVSEATRTELSGLGVAPQRVTVVHNGTPPLPATEVARTTYPSLIVLGRLVPHKRVEIALHTVAALAPELPDLRLVVAGQGWWEPQLRRLAAELGIAEHVDFAGFVTEQEKATLLASSWLALTPSMQEGWGLTIVEAGAAGTPTVAFRDAGGVAEAVVDGQTGLLAGNTDDYIEKVRDLLNDEQARQRMGAAARSHAATFTWATSGERFAALLLHNQAEPVTRLTWSRRPAV